MIERSPKDLLSTSQKMRMSLKRLDDLKSELDGIQVTEEELNSISKHVSALEDVLTGSKKSRVNFSNVRTDDLKRAGVIRKRLVLKAGEVTNLANALSTNIEAEIIDLHSKIKKIYACVNMDYEPGSRMILHAVLLRATEIASVEHRSVAILPGMRIPEGEEAHVTHPESGYELWLSGNVDYAIFEYEDKSDHKDRLLSPGGSRDDAFNVSKSCMLLVEAKRESLERSFITYVPEAVSQAILLLKFGNLPEIRFCLSDGQSWIFFILKSENGTLTYYESVIHRLSRDMLEMSDMPLREILQLMSEWLRPTATDLFLLE